MTVQVLAEFTSADAMLAALEQLRDNGYRQLEAYGPYPAGGIADRLGLSASLLPRLVFAGGLLGAVLGYGIQWYANVYDFPLNVGGRPVHSVPAFIPATFEGAVLCAALTAFVGLFVLIRLPALWHPVFEVDGFERASIDRYWVGVGGQPDPLDLSNIRQLLDPLRPVQVVPVEAEE